MLSHRTLGASCLVFLSVLCLSGARVNGEVIPITWTGGTGNWSNSANWSPSLVPNNSVTDVHQVLISGGQGVDGADVSLDMNATIGGLNTYADATLTILDNRSLGITAGGTNINDGSITLASQGSYTDLRAFGGDVELSGAGKVILQGGNNRILGSNNQTDRLINGPDHTIEGAGAVGFDTLGIINEGLIVANLERQTLSINPSMPGVTNRGSLRASNGATLQLDGGYFANHDGLIRPDSGSFLQLFGVTVAGGRLEVPDQAVMTVNGNGAVVLGDGIDFHNRAGGTVTVKDNQVLSFEAGGYFRNDGAITLASQGSYTDLRAFGGDVELSGAGKVILQGGNNRILGSNNQTDRLINGPDHTIEGAGAVGFDTLGIINEGLIVANLERQTLRVDPNLSGFVNRGNVLVRHESTLAMGNGDLFRQDAGRTTVNGRLVASPNMQVLAGELHGAGDIVGNVQIGYVPIAGTRLPQALVSAGDPASSSTGRLGIDGAFTQTTHGVFRADLAGLDDVEEYDVIDVTKAAQVSGELHVATVGDFLPQLGDTFDILTASGGVEGTFETVTAEPRTDDLGWKVNYFPDRVQLQLTPFDDFATLVDPRATFLRTLNDESQSSTPQPPLVIDLQSALGAAVQTGDVLRLEVEGEFEFNRANTGDSLHNMVGVFSASDSFDAISEIPLGGDIHRVNDAINAEVPYETIAANLSSEEYPGGLPTDIPEDFLITGTSLIQVPAGARYLFVGADDQFWSDNSDIDQDFSLRIERLPAFTLGDTDADGDVDLADLNNVRNNFGTTGDNVLGDTDLDNDVDLADLNHVRNYFGATSSQAHPVPEPSTLVVSLVVFLCAAATLRHRISRSL